VRRTLAFVSAAVTSMVAIAFLIPLAVVVAAIARDQAFGTAALQAAALEPTLSGSTRPQDLDHAISRIPGLAVSRVAVYVAPPGTSARSATASQLRLIAGTPRASTGTVAAAIRASASLRTPVPGGYALFQPVRLGSGQLALVEVFVPAALLSRGVLTSWLVMAAVGMALVGVAVIVSDRLAMHVTRPARALADAAARLGDGDLTARSEPAGPPELTAAGEAFNTMAERLTRMIAAERVMAADLPHRLRTPLTALRMTAAALGPSQVAEETRLAVVSLEQEVDRIIRAARRPAIEEPSSCDAAEVLQDRMDFWSALAEDQGRAWHLTGAGRPVQVPVARPDLVAVADALLGNVFLHTAEGTEFAVTLHSGNGVVAIFFADAGPGIDDPKAALERGSSSGGSTGLGLDIARRVAQSTGGELRIDRSALGGAQLQLWLRTGPDRVVRPGRSRARRSRISAG
jgi:signal transduction histidine kinase